MNNKNIDFFAHISAKLVVGIGLVIYGGDNVFSNNYAQQIAGIVLVAIGSYHIITANSLYKKRKK